MSDKHETMIQFTYKVIRMLIPGVILGLLIDNSIRWIQYNIPLDSIVCILIQTFIMILTIYFLRRASSLYTDEFQNTLSGLFFVSLYFGLQSNYCTNIHNISDKLFGSSLPP
jgi:hypothetical protein